MANMKRILFFLFLSLGIVSAKEASAAGDTLVFMRNEGVISVIRIRGSDTLSYQRLAGNMGVKVTNTDKSGSIFTSFTIEAPACLFRETYYLNSTNGANVFKTNITGLPAGNVDVTTSSITAIANSVSIAIFTSNPFL